MHVIADASKFKVCKVVDAQNVEWETRQGWVVVAILDEQKIERNEPHYYSNYGDRPSPPAPAPIVLQQCRYLLGLDENTAVAQAQTETDKWRTEVGALQTKYGDAERQLKEKSETLAQTVKAEEAASARANRTANELVKLQDSYRKVEADIGKLRDAFGTVRVKEILEGEAIS